MIIIYESKESLNKEDIEAIKSVIGYELYPIGTPKNIGNHWLYGVQCNTLSEKSKSFLREKGLEEHIVRKKL